MPWLVLRWNFTHTRSFCSLIRLYVWLPKPCM